MGWLITKYAITAALPSIWWVMRSITSRSVVSGSAASASISARFSSNTANASASRVGKWR